MRILGVQKKFKIFKYFSDSCGLSPVFLVVTLSILLSEALHSLRRREVWSLLLVSFLVLALLLAVAVIWRQPQSTTKAAFMVNRRDIGDGQEFKHFAYLQFHNRYYVRWVSQWALLRGHCRAQKFNYKIMACPLRGDKSGLIKNGITAFWMCIVLLWDFLKNFRGPSSSQTEIEFCQTTLCRMLYWC